MNRRPIVLAARWYPAAALTFSAAFIEPAVAFLPVLLLSWYVFKGISRRRGPAWDRACLLTDYFVYFAVPAIAGNRIGILAALIALPILGVLVLDMIKIRLTPPPVFREGARRPTPMMIVLLAVAAAMLLYALPFNMPGLAAAGIGALLIFSALYLTARSRLRRNKIDITRASTRLLAGRSEKITISLTSRTTWAGRLAIRPIDDWAQIDHGWLDLTDGKRQDVQIEVTPPLSGPRTINTRASLTDSIGLITAGFTFPLADLQVIPRARYAAWIAGRYIQGTRPGRLPLISSTSFQAGSVTSRTGIEYYGSRMYQPGDSLREIDWKHSVKLNRLVSKEFSELRGRAALLLVNLSARNEEEADRLAYNIIAVALTLTQEGVPYSAAIYDAEQVLDVTSTLRLSETVTHAIKVSQHIRLAPLPRRFIRSPDVRGLASNIARLGPVESEPAQKMASLLRAELASIRLTALANPCTEAVRRGLRQSERECNIVSVSARNHDTEAIAYNAWRLRKQGYGFFDI